MEALQRLMGDAGQRSAEEGTTKEEEEEEKVVLEEVEVAAVDVYERQAVPYGLVRFGVAPDHPEVKAVQHRYDAFMADPRLRFIGNVSVKAHHHHREHQHVHHLHKEGQLTVAELLEAYDAVILAVGAQRDRPLGVPGEDLPAVHSARTTPRRGTKQTQKKIILLFIYNKYKYK